MCVYNILSPLNTNARFAEVSGEQVCKQMIIFLRHLLRPVFIWITFEGNKNICFSLALHTTHTFDLIQVNTYNNGIMQFYGMLKLQISEHSDASSAFLTFINPHQHVTCQPSTDLSHEVLAFHKIANIKSRLLK